MFYSYFIPAHIQSLFYLMTDKGVVESQTVKLVEHVVNQMNVGMGTSLSTLVLWALQVAEVAAYDCMSLMYATICISITNEPHSFGSIHM